MAKTNLPPLARGLQHGEAHFQCRHRPRPIMQRRLSIEHRSEKLIDHFEARDVRRRERISCAVPFW